MRLFTFFFAFYIHLSWAQQSTEKKMTVPEYIDSYKADAIKNMIDFKIPASITLAQGILESAVGNSPLAREANNHFGIKCHKGWEGATYIQDDDEKDECFRKYKSVYDSYADHANFLITRSRYSALFELEITDYKGWAHGLKKAGYATAPDYAEKLISLIERFDLQDFDKNNKVAVSKTEKEEKSTEPKPLEEKGAPPKEGKPNDTNQSKGEDYSWRKPNKAEIKEAGKGKIVPQEEIDIWGNRTERVNNDVKYIIAGKNDTKQKIADHFQMNIFLINKFNEFEKTSEVKEGDIVYLQPKRNKSKYIDSHTVKSGETLFFISQTYGVKLKSILKINNLTSSSALKEGEIIKLK